MSDTAVPTPPPAPESQPGAVAPKPAPAPRAPGSPTTLFWRRPDSATLSAALIAVGVAGAIQLVSELLYVIEQFAWAIDDGFDSLSDTFGDFLLSGILRALFFLVPAFLALWQLLPIAKESPLATVLKRAAVAGVAGLAGLILFGIVEAIVDIGRYQGFYLGYFSVTWLWYPIVVGLALTVQLLVGATIAWIRANRAPAPAATAPPVPPAAPPAAPPPTAPQEPPAPPAAPGA